MILYLDIPLPASLFFKIIQCNTIHKLTSQESGVLDVSGPTSHRAVNHKGRSYTEHGPRKQDIFTSLHHFYNKQVVLYLVLNLRKNEKSLSKVWQEIKCYFTPVLIEQLFSIDFSEVEKLPCETFQTCHPFNSCPLNGSVLQKTGHALPSIKKSIITLNLFTLHTK